MKNDLTAQQNQFGQTVGFAIENNKKCYPVLEAISGQYVELTQIDKNIAEQAIVQLWQAIATEPDERCWTIYLILHPKTSKV